MLFISVCFFQHHIYSADDIEIALHAFKAHHGHLDIALGYKIDSSSRDGHIYAGLAGMEGAPLGEMLADIKKRCLYFTVFDLYERWRPLGIRLNRRAYTKFQSQDSDMDDSIVSKGVHVSNIQRNDPKAKHRAVMLLEALSIYKQHYGSLFSMPYDYCINEKEQHLYPPHLHGFRLSGIAGHVLQRCDWMKDPYGKELIKIGLVPPTDEVSRHLSLRLIAS
jgi:hypothetical protein